jgi:nucleoside-diphosphate-sugar epimerase
MDESINRLAGKKVLITGGGGYLGSKLAERLAPLVSGCFLTDRKFSDFSLHLAGKYPSVKLINADITRKETIHDICRITQPDFIFHFAAFLDRTRDFNVFNEACVVNVTGTLNLLEGAIDVPYESFCFAGTAEVYGPENPLPFREDQLPLPVSPYSLTKLMAEDLIRSWSGLHGKPWTIFRIFLFWDPEMPETTFIPQLLKAYKEEREFFMTPGRQRRDWLLTGDLISYITHLAGLPGARNEIINLCSGTSVSLEEIVNHVRELSNGRLKVNASLPYRENEIWDMRGAVDKLSSLLPEIKPEPLFSGIRNFFKHDRRSL